MPPTNSPITSEGQRRIQLFVDELAAGSPVLKAADAAGIVNLKAALARLDREMLLRLELKRGAFLANAEEKLLTALENAIEDAIAGILALAKDPKAAASVRLDAFRDVLNRHETAAAAHIERVGKRVAAEDAAQLARETRSGERAGEEGGGPIDLARITNLAELEAVETQLARRIAKASAEDAQPAADRADLTAFG